MRCGSAGHLPREALSSPTTQQLSRGLGSGGVNNREADVPPPSRSLLAEAAVAGIRVNNQVEAANKQSEEENNHSDGKQQALVCLHALNHMLYRTPRCCCCCCYLLHRHYMERPQVQGEPQRRALSPLKCKVAAEAEAAAAALLHQTSLFFSYNGMRAVNRRLRGRKDKKKKKHLIVGQIITGPLLVVCFFNCSFIFLS